MVLSDARGGLPTERLAGGRIHFQRYATNYGGPKRKNRPFSKDTAAGGSSMQKDDTAVKITGSLPNVKLFIAHRRLRDFEVQEVHKHLFNVASLSRRHAAKFRLPIAGGIIGLLHDFSKYSAAFQHYFHPQHTGGEKVDHSTAGSQFIWHNFMGREPDRHGSRSSVGIGHSVSPRRHDRLPLA